jgi:hypothetical protein
MKILEKLINGFGLLALSTSSLLAQENEISLQENIQLKGYMRTQSNNAARVDLILPFFEDFTTEDYYPSLTKWSDSSVFINSTLAKNIKSRGVATFDCLNAWGVPYNPDNALTTVYADSLTSNYFDLSAYTAADSIYLSFQFQSKGNGYAPLAGDSLMVYFQRRSGAWTKVWSKAGSSMDVFHTAVVPITDTHWLHEDFRFRFVNKATYNVGNSHWHVDYIKIDRNRTFNDSLYNDLAFTYWGENNLKRGLVKDYTSIPLKHFNADRANLIQTELSASVWNSWAQTQEFDATMILRNNQTSATEVLGTLPSFALYNDAQFLTFNLPANSSIFNANGADELDIEMFCSFNPILNDYSKENDTIKYTQQFANYFAYDDGSAETAFFMTAYDGAPSYVAQEYALAVADTLRGVDIYFPRQVPSAHNKSFFIQVYKNIDAVGGQDELVYQEEQYPSYGDAVNSFVRYRFANPVILPEGSFYLALMFPAGGNSDSLYIGLDKNKAGANFRYFKVLDHWVPSTIDGALMIRPLVGAELPVGIATTTQSLGLEVYPNPVSNSLNLKLGTDKPVQYVVRNVLGVALLSGVLQNATIDCNTLDEGVYFIQIVDEAGNTAVKQFLKIK